MNNIIVFLFIICINYNAYSQNTVHVKGYPDKVTVFQSGANLTMNMKASVKKGTNLVYIDSIPPNIDPNSIRVYAGSSAAVMSTDFILETIKIDKQTEPSNILSIRDSIALLQYLVKDLSNRINVLQGEEAIITKYQLHPETEKGSSIQELTTLANYYNKRVNEIKKEILGYFDKQTEYDRSITRLKNLITEYEATKISLQNYQIVATLSSEVDANINIDLNVFTPNAGWIPNYEIKVKDITSPVTLTYKANVFQSTGRDWDEVKLVLSTRNPNMSNVMPILVPWYLSLVTSTKHIATDEMDSPLTPTYQANSVRSSKVREGLMEVQGLSTGVIDNKYMTVEFAPTNKYSIISDNRKQSITLNDVDAPSVYEYYVAPKLDNDAFLIAKIPDWGKLNLLAGEAYIYFENTYIGKSYINPQSTDDSLSISLGRDKSILVKRDIVQNMTETKFFSSNVVKEYGYMITVKNNRKTDINITVEDQYPVTTHEKIEVELLETSGAKIDKEKGFLKWVLNIPSGKSIDKKFGYKIDSPK